MTMRPASGRRRTAAALAVAGALALAACGDSAADEPAPDTAGEQTAADEPADDASADEPATDEPATDEPATDEPADDTEATGLGGTTPADEATGKPSIQLPTELPTELVITDLVEGEGEPAEIGDTVEMNYVGVVTATGVEFDHNYGIGQNLSLLLGGNQVIPGFETGIQGVKTGTRRQLDIPADLAYGDQGAGGVIAPGDAITFVVDIISVTKRVPPVIPPMADPSDCPATDGSEAQQREFESYPPFCLDADTTYTATIVTNFGEFSIELDQARAPLAANSFVTLARYHYFDGTECHRAIPSFVVQCGDPTATGTGGPGYAFPDELPLPGEYEIGSIAMANSGPDTNGSQFFIITGPNGAALPPSYSLFGQVSDGLDTTVAALDAVANPGDNGVPPLEQILIESVTITES